jgi:hypothetical protein
LTSVPLRADVGSGPSRHFSATKLFDRSQGITDIIGRAGELRLNQKGSIADTVVVRQITQDPQSSTSGSKIGSVEEHGDWQFFTDA